MLKHIELFHSQYGEDKFIAEHPPFGFDLAKGTFCEVGAFDGVASSNTLAFEEAGWTGVLIEPDPQNAARCMSNRKSPVWCCACGGAVGYRKFYLNDADRGTSSLYREGRPIPTLVCPLRELLWFSGFQSIDLLSIDTEGSELEVWQSIGDYRPKIVIVEYWTMPDPPNPRPLVEQFTRDGYEEVNRTTANIIFYRK